MPTRRVTFEEEDNNGVPPNPPLDEGEFSPPDHPWQYGDEQAKIHIADILLNPTDDKLKEFTFTPQGMVLDECLADTMVAMQKNYHNKTFNAAEYLIKTIDQRFRSLEGKMVKYGVYLAGEEKKDEDINPLSGPMI